MTGDLTEKVAQQDWVICGRVKGESSSAFLAAGVVAHLLSSGVSHPVPAAALTKACQRGIATATLVVECRETVPREALRSLAAGWLRETQARL